MANNFSDSRCRCLCPPLKSISDDASVYFGSDAAEATTCTSEKVVRPAVVEAIKKDVNKVCEVKVIQGHGLTKLTLVQYHKFYISHFRLYQTERSKHTVTRAIVTMSSEILVCFVFE